MSISGSKWCKSVLTIAASGTSAASHSIRTEQSRRGPGVQSPVVGRARATCVDPAAFDTRFIRAAPAGWRRRFPAGREDGFRPQRPQSGSWRSPTVRDRMVFVRGRSSDPAGCRRRPFDNCVDRLQALEATSHVLPRAIGSVAVFPLDRRVYMTPEYSHTLRQNMPRIQKKGPQLRNYGPRGEAYRRNYLTLTGISLKCISKR